MSTAVAELNTNNRAILYNRSVLSRLTFGLLGNKKSTRTTAEPTFSGTVSIIIPCYNEEKTIERCVLSCLNQTRPADEIIVINDGSTDRSGEILDKYADRITHLNLEKNTGNKSLAQEAGLSHVTTDTFIATDADTILDKKFVEKIVRGFTNPKTVAVGGYIHSTKQNWITACRELDYVIGQNFHKVAQSFMNCLFVIPGCAGAFRTKEFRQYITFDHDTITEDLDFTYKFNENNLHIHYEREAIVYTQDPSDLHSYIHQMRRWYSGGWQNLKKHLRIFSRSTNALELSMIYFEGLIFAMLVYVLPIINIRVYLYALIPFFGFVALLGIYAAIVRRRIDLFFYSPMYVVMYYINAYVFLSEFVREIILKKKQLSWFKPVRRSI